MSETVKEFENEEVVAEEVITEEVKAEEEKTEQAETEEFCFEEALEKSLKTIKNGEKVVGLVVGMSATEVFIDVGTKHAGFVALSELTDDPTAKAEDVVKKGDEINLVVVRVNDVEGVVQLSKRRYDAIKGYEKVEAAAEDNSILDAVVNEVIKGGLVVTTHGVKVFVPASQATLSRNDSLEALVKQPVQIRIIEKGRGRRRSVGSIKSVLLDSRKELAEKFWATAEVGGKYTGPVKSLTSYGAFVDLGGVDGMVHISELSWKRIHHPNQVVNVGDVIEVYIKDIDEENKKISLGYRKTEDNPFEIFKAKFSVGDVVEGKVVSLTDFGAFVEIIDGVDGLVHISQISNERINKASDVLTKGQDVTVKITDIDADGKRISLSIKALLDDAPAPVEAPEEPAAEVAEEAPEQPAEEVAAEVAEEASEELAE